MAEPNQNLSEHVVWARRANSRWIVHRGLSQSAGDYLDHLERTDPDRLERSCRRARQLVKESGAAQDPKPWFYAGLFCLATADEAARHLADHEFTRAVIPSLAQDPGAQHLLETVGEDTREKIETIRAAVAGLESESGSA